MKNQLVDVKIVALFLGVAIHVVSAQISGIAVPCNDNQNCTDSRLPENALCQSGFCVCIETNGVARNCSMRVQPKTADHNPVTSHPCKIDQDCKFPNAVCNTTRSQCECASSHVMAAEPWKCLPIAKKLEDNCEENQQCRLSTIGNNTVCENGHCSCISGYHYSGNSCWKSAAFSESCLSDNECSHIEHAECNENLQCACSKNSIVNSDGQRCLLIATRLLDSCIEREQCTKNFTDFDCIDKRCQCRENNHYEPSLSKCVSSRSLGESCTADYECFQDEEENMGQPQRCVKNICTCDEKFRNDGEKCVSLVSGRSSSLVSGLSMIILPVLLLVPTS